MWKLQKCKSTGAWYDGGKKLFEKRLRRAVDIDEMKWVLCQERVQLMPFFQLDR